MKRLVQSRKTFVTLAALALIALPAADAAAKVNKTCKHFPHQSPWSPTAPNQIVAKNWAVSFWQSGVQTTHGPQWSNWYLASLPSIACKPSTNKKPGTTCQAKAKPCKLFKKPAASVPIPPPDFGLGFRRLANRFRAPQRVMRRPFFSGSFSSASPSRRRLR